MLASPRPLSVSVSFVTVAMTVAVASASCKSADTTATPADAGAPCTTLFGTPNAHTGLDASSCAPQCGWGADAFVPPTYDDAFVQSLLSDWVLATPFPPLTSDPYAGPPPPADPPATVCGVLPGAAASTPRSYTLVTYPSADAATAAGAHVTHFGHCGVCSTLANLAVYIRNDDLVAPVRSCGLQPSADGGDGGDVTCLEALGFDLPCAQAWAYNTAHTRDVCTTPCFANLTAPYNEPDGALNACLQCDEDMSGPVFKVVAGRTRRNSGVPNAICRPCGEVQPLVQAY